MSDVASGREEIDRVTEAVLSVYARVNPSFVEDLEVDGARMKYVRTMIELFTGKLQLPPITFRDASLLDVGSGTGETSLVFALLGARVLGVDVNGKAVALARARAEKWGLSSRSSFEVGSVFDLSSDQMFDVVTSFGMLHHTADPKGGFDRIAPLVGPGGVLILALNEPAGYFQRRAQRYLVNTLAGDDEGTKVRVACLLFAESLGRASRTAGRSIEAAAYDTFVNPQIRPVAVNEVEMWMNEHGIKLDRTWPPIDLPLISDSQYHPRLPSNHPAVGAWRDVTRLAWLLKKDLDADLHGAGSPGSGAAEAREFLNAIDTLLTDVSFDAQRAEELASDLGRIETTPLPGLDLAAELRTLLMELAEIDRTVRRERSEGATPEEIAGRIRLRRAFAGFHGVGLVYYRGTRPATVLDGLQPPPTGRMIEAPAPFPHETTAPSAP